MMFLGRNPSGHRSEIDGVKPKSRRTIRLSGRKTAAQLNAVLRPTPLNRPE